MIRRYVTLLAILGLLFVVVPRDATAATPCRDQTVRAGKVHLTGWKFYIQRHVKWCWRQTATGNYKQIYHNSAGASHYPKIIKLDPQFPGLLAWEWDGWLGPRQPVGGSNIAYQSWAWYDLGLFAGVDPDGRCSGCTYVAVGLSIITHPPDYVHHRGWLTLKCTLNGVRVSCYLIN